MRSRILDTLGNDIVNYSGFYTAGLVQNPSPGWAVAGRQLACAGLQCPDFKYTISDNTLESRNQGIFKIFVGLRTGSSDCCNAARIRQVLGWIQNCEKTLGSNRSQDSLNTVFLIA